tara:strand:+ start:131 stop:268 length:138 start_codon:yes stop_codon:yes gene_type:complete
MSSKYKEVQADALKAFKEEIPSIYYSDKTEKEYIDWKKSMNYIMS